MARDSYRTAIRKRQDFAAFRLPPFAAAAMLEKHCTNLTESDPANAASTDTKVVGAVFAVH
jgi:hypothetical protein